MDFLHLIRERSMVQTPDQLDLILLTSCINDLGSTVRLSTKLKGLIKQEVKAIKEWLRASFEEEILPSAAIITSSAED